MNKPICVDQSTGSAKSIITSDAVATNEFLIAAALHSFQLHVLHLLSVRVGLNVGQLGTLLSCQGAWSGLVDLLQVCKVVQTLACLYQTMDRHFIPIDELWRSRCETDEVWCIIWVCLSDRVEATVSQLMQLEDRFEISIYLHWVNRQFGLRRSELDDVLEAGTYHRLVREIEQILFFPD